MVSRAYFFHFCGSKIAVLKLWSSVPVDLILFAFLKMLIFELNNFKKSENFGPSFITGIISHSSFLSPHSSSYISYSPLPILNLPFPISHSPLPILRSPLSIPHSPFSILQSPFLFFPTPRYPLPSPQSSFTLLVSSRLNLGLVSRGETLKIRNEVLTFVLIEWGWFVAWLELYIEKGKKS